MNQTFDRNILVTGGAGYIGSHASKALAAAGYLPIAFDNLSTGHADAVKWGPLVVGDLRVGSEIAAALFDYRPLAIMHFAASAYVGESVTDPGKYYANNVFGMQTLLDAARNAGVYNVVLSSSCATYGIPDNLPITESSLQLPINPYGRTKLVCEMMLKDYSAAYGLKHAILRYFNVAGADPEGALVEDHDPETHLIPRILMAASGAIDAVEVFGNDYPTADGTCVRDYVHVTDLANGHLLALQNIARSDGSYCFNLGSGTGYSVHQIIHAAERITARAVPVRNSPRRPGDPPELIADVSRAKMVLGFSTRFSDLETIITTAFKALQSIRH